ncbi:MAG: hypothetical protein KBH11_04225, partial [Bacteroidia bacterium]|nr:hypothetical protein [Bacteroidia bacterium]
FQSIIYHLSSIILTKFTSEQKFLIPLSFANFLSSHVNGLNSIQHLLVVCRWRRDSRLFLQDSFLLEKNCFSKKQRTANGQQFRII